jgi:hypothetical protein
MLLENNNQTRYFKEGMKNTNLDCQIQLGVGLIQGSKKSFTSSL